jgi:hypothetical protein
LLLSYRLFHQKTKCNKLYLTHHTQLPLSVGLNVSVAPAARCRPRALSAPYLAALLEVLEPLETQLHKIVAAESSHLWTPSLTDAIPLPCHATLRQQIVPLIQFSVNGSFVPPDAATSQSAQAKRTDLATTENAAASFTTTPACETIADVCAQLASILRLNPPTAPPPPDHDSYLRIPADKLPRHSGAGLPPGFEPRAPPRVADSAAAIWTFPAGYESAFFAGQASPHVRVLLALGDYCSLEMHFPPSSAQKTPSKLSLEAGMPIVWDERCVSRFVAPHGCTLLTWLVPRAP